MLRLARPAPAPLTRRHAQAHKAVQAVFSRRYKDTCVYLLLVEEYLELVSSRDSQRAFDLMVQRLKPLEAVGEAHAPGQFHDLCYLLSCHSVQSAPSFRDWGGRAEGRSQLVERLDALWQLESRHQGGLAPMASKVPVGRLTTLLQQAVAHQIERSRYHPRLPPRVETLLDDYRCVVVPNAAMGAFAGHEDNVKCVTFAGNDHLFLASGSSDNTVRLWPTDRASWQPRAEADADSPDADSADAASLDRCRRRSLHPLYEERCSVRLGDQASRVWDVAAPPRGTALASAGGNGTVCVWGAGPVMEALHTAAGSPRRAVAGGARTELRRADGKLVGTLPAEVPDLAAAQESADACSATSLRGHSGDVYSVAWLPQGQHVVSAGYDRTVRLWDLEREEAVSVR